MGMFDNYNNIDKDYIPTNENKCCGKNNIPFVKAPNVEYNVENEPVGYYWYYGDTINLRIHLTGSIKVAQDSIIYTATGQAPTTETVGIIDQKAYNVIDLISWTCTAIIDSDYIWTQDDDFITPDAGKGVYFTAEKYLEGKTVRATIYNFRHEQVDNKIFLGNTIITYPIDAELSNKLVKGVYYLEVVVCDELKNSYRTVIDDACLIVK